MISFDEPELLRRLSALSPLRRAAFAALVTERLMPGCEGLEAADGRDVHETLSRALSEAWKRIDVDLPGEMIQREVDTCISLLPGDADNWARFNPFAEDVVAAAVYALQSLQSESAKEATWAAQCGYNVVDRFVVAPSDIHMGPPAAELGILSHPLIQSELRSQAEDLASLGDPILQMKGKGLTVMRDHARANAHTYLRRRSQN